MANARHSVHRVFFVALPIFISGCVSSAPTDARIPEAAVLDESKRPHSPIPGADPQIEHTITQMTKVVRWSFGPSGPWPVLDRSQFAAVGAIWSNQLPREHAIELLSNPETFIVTHVILTYAYGPATSYDRAARQWNGCQLRFSNAGEGVFVAKPFDEESVKKVKDFWQAHPMTKPHDTDPR